MSNLHLLQGSIADTIAGLDWVAGNAQLPAVVLLSLGVARGQWSQALEAATRSLVLDSNITVVVASGNLRTNSCNIVPGAPSAPSVGLQHGQAGAAKGCGGQGNVG